MTALRTLGALTGIIVLLAGSATDSNGQQFVSTGRDTLRGLPGVEVLVEDLQPEIEQAGFTGASIQAEVQNQLRARGITVFASQSANVSPAKPYLYIHLNALELPAGQGHVVNVQLHLRQTLRSTVTESNIVNAMTWDMENLISLPAGRFQEVRTELRDYVDRFIQDWLAVH